MSDLVTFVAPADWRDQLDGADPIRLFETWIVPTTATDEQVRGWGTHAVVDGHPINEEPT